MYTKSAILMESGSVVTPLRHQCRGCPSNYLRRNGLKRHVLGVHHCGLGFRSTVMIPLFGEELRVKLVRLKLQQRNGTVRRAQAAAEASSGSSLASSPPASCCRRAPASRCPQLMSEAVDCSEGQVQLEAGSAPSFASVPLACESPLLGSVGMVVQDRFHLDDEGFLPVCPDSPVSSFWEVPVPSSSSMGLVQSSVEQVEFPAGSGNEDLGTCGGSCCVNVSWPSDDDTSSTDSFIVLSNDVRDGDFT